MAGSIPRTWRSSHQWKVHYFSADMADNAEHRAEDEAFLLGDMPAALVARAMSALEGISRPACARLCGH